MATTHPDLTEHPDLTVPDDRTVPDNRTAPEQAALPLPGPAHTAPTQPADGPCRPGRPLDRSRDAEILAAALDVLVEHGYEGTTVDMVAARARAGKATLYRRWPSKDHLVMDAVAGLKNAHLTELPDTGTLREDLLTLLRPRRLAASDRQMQVVSGVMSQARSTPALMALLHEAVLRPREEALRALLRRAVQRGEIRADADVETLATIGSALGMYRHLRGDEVCADELVRVIDNVVLPAVALPR